MKTLNERECAHIDRIKEIIQCWKLDPELLRTLLEKIEASRPQIDSSFRMLLLTVCPDKRIQLKFQEINMLFFEQLREERWKIIFMLMSQIREEAKGNGARKTIRRIDCAMPYLQNKYMAR